MDKGQQMRFTDEELAILRGTFKGNERLVKLMRKVFLPEYDVNAPLGQVIDLWMTLDFRGMNQQEREVQIYARNQLINHIETRLIEINTLANMKEETAEEKEERQNKDSAK